jgi:hypothetical protein
MPCLLHQILAIRNCVPVRSLQHMPGWLAPAAPPSLLQTESPDCYGMVVEYVRMGSLRRGLHKLKEQAGGGWGRGKSLRWWDCHKAPAEQSLCTNMRLLVTEQPGSGHGLQDWGP